MRFSSYQKDDAAAVTTTTTPSSRATPLGRSYATGWPNFHKAPSRRYSSDAKGSIKTSPRKCSSTTYPNCSHQFLWFGLVSQILNDFAPQWTLIRAGIDLAEHGYSRFNPEMDAPWNSILQFFTIVHYFHSSENASLQKFALQMRDRVALEESRRLRDSHSDLENLIYSILKGDATRADRLSGNIDLQDIKSLDELYIIGSYKIFLKFRACGVQFPLKSDTPDIDAADLLRRQLSDFEQAWSSHTDLPLNDPYLYKVLGVFDRARDLYKKDWNRWKLKRRHIRMFDNMILSNLSVFDITSLAVPFGFADALRHVSKVDLIYLPGYDFFVLQLMIYLLNQKLKNSDGAREFCTLNSTTVTRATIGPSASLQKVSDWADATNQCLERYLLVRDTLNLPVSEEKLDEENRCDLLKAPKYMEVNDFDLITFANRRLIPALAYYACLIAFVLEDFHMTIKLAQEFTSLKVKSDDYLVCDSKAILYCTDDYACHVGLLKWPKFDRKKLLEIYSTFLTEEPPMNTYWRCVTLCECLSFLSLACERKKVEKVGSFFARRSIGVKESTPEDCFERLQTWHHLDGNELIGSILKIIIALWHLTYTHKYEIAICQFNDIDLPKMYGLVGFWSNQKLCLRSKDFCVCPFNQLQVAPDFTKLTDSYLSNFRVHVIQLLIGRFINATVDEIGGGSNGISWCLDEGVGSQMTKVQGEKATFLMKFEYWLRDYCKYDDEMHVLDPNLWVQAHLYLGKLRSLKKKFEKIKNQLSHIVMFSWLHQIGDFEACLKYPNVHLWRGESPVAWATLQIFEKMIDIHLRRRNNAQVLELALQIFLRYPQHVKAHFLCADSYLKTNALSLCEKHYYAALAQLENSSAHNRLFIQDPELSKIVRAFRPDYDTRVCLSSTEAEIMRITCIINLSYCDFVQSRFSSSVDRLANLIVSRPIDVILRSSLMCYVFLELNDHERCHSVLECLTNEQQRISDSSEIYRLYTAQALLALHQSDLEVMTRFATLPKYHHDKYEVWYVIALINAQLDGLVTGTSCLLVPKYLQCAIESATCPLEADFAQLCISYSEYSQSPKWASILDKHVDLKYAAVHSNDDSSDIHSTSLLDREIPVTSRLYWCGSLAFNLRVQFCLWRLLYTFTQCDEYNDAEGMSDLIRIAQARQKKPGGRKMLELILSDDVHAYTGIPECLEFIRVVGTQMSKFDEFIKKLINDLECGTLEGYSASQLLPVPTLFVTSCDLLTYKRILLLSIISLHRPPEMLNAGARKAKKPLSARPRRCPVASPQSVPCCKEFGKLRVYHRRDLTLGRLIGSGGFGHVYKGLTVDGKCVAIKLFKGISAGSEILKEVRALSDLEHPNLVKLYGVCLSPVATISELCEYGTLAALLHSNKKSLTQNQRFLILWKVARALSYVHEQRLIHRDVKPANILLCTSTHEPKICDFGLSNKINIDCTHVSLGRNSAAQAGGSPRYMPPETFNVGSVVNEKVDLWSFGCVCLETLTGRAPYHTLTDYPQVKKAVLALKEKPFDVSLVENLPNKLAKLIFQCFEFVASDRPNMREMELSLKLMLAD